MCPSPPTSLPDDIDFHCSDEEAVMSLEKILSGAPLPANVIAGMNPCRVFPGYLPDDVWYLSNPEGSKDTEIGYWKATGEDCTIFTNSCTIGSRRTLEYFSGEAPYGNKTDWVMHEYKIDCTGSCKIDKAQDFSSISRIFLNYGHSSPRIEEQNEKACVHDANQNSIGNSEGKQQTSQDSTNRSQGVNRNDEHEPDNSILHRYGKYDFSSGDFLELRDLDNPVSTSSSSARSSFLAYSSDDYFDASALVRVLDAENNQDTQRKHTDTKFSVTASFIPHKVVMRPESLGYLPGSNRCLLASEEDPAVNTSLLNLAVKQNGTNSSKHVPQTLTAADVNRKHSTALQKEVASSSSSGNGPAALAEAKSKTAVDRKTKPRKKYWCFMPF